MELQATPRIPVDLLATQADRLAGLVRSGRTSLAEDAAKSKEALRQAALSFEALFYSTLIKQLRQTTQELGEGLFAGDEADIFGGLFDYYLGQFLAQRQQLGIGRLIQEHYERWQTGAAKLSQETPEASGSEPRLSNSPRATSSV
jgi:Rod binding domain-containing protein